MNRDTDGSPEGRDAQRLDGGTATAGAGTASHEHRAITPQQADRKAAALIQARIADHLRAAGFTIDEVAEDAWLVEQIAHHAQQARLEERERAAVMVEDRYGGDCYVALAIRKGEAA